VNRMALRKDSASLSNRSPAAANVRKEAPGGGAATQARRGAAAEPAGESLEQCVFRSLDQYFADLGGAKPHALHEMVLGAIEKPLLQFALQRCDGNQSAAADLLGINRNTLRRKLQDYGLH
jgi:Fis family transcriptional regulator, factor for inversion stimulation protein